VNPYFQVLAFTLMVDLIILSVQLSNIKHGVNIYLSIEHQYYHSLMFLFLLDAAQWASSFNNREMRTIRIEFLTLQGKT
jgi:hypothetical protein